MIAIESLCAVADGGFVQPTINSLTDTKLQINDRRLIREIVMGVLRHQGWLDLQLSRHLKGGIQAVDADVLQALRVAAFQLLKLDRIPNHAAVASTVEAYKRLFGRKAGGFVNGVLRSVLRSPISDGADDDTPESIASKHSLPLWLAKKWSTQLGIDGLHELAACLNTPAPLTIRPTTLQHSETLIERLETEGATWTHGEWTDYALRVKHPDPFNSQSFKDGLWLAQDEASQIACELLTPQPNEQIWDMCAAPGGKTDLIMALSEQKARYVATDVNPRKTEALTVKLKSSVVEILTHDATQPLENRRFDRILLDAPCSAMGVIRRHPEIKWRRSQSDIEQNATQQRALLQNAAQHLRPNGILVYAVCSPMPEEGIRQAQHFIATMPEFELAPPVENSSRWATLWDAEGIQLHPHLHNTDGFFITRFKRKG